jgi:hypothetical protein
MKKYDAEVQPQDMVFDRMAIWARILSLPNRLMNSTRGKVIAEPIGVVKWIDADSLGRCWGGFMRLRVEVKVDEPLLRAVTVYSSLLQTTESFVVQYERLPIYCFSDPAVCWDILPLPAPIRLIGMSKVSSLILQEGCRLMTMSGNLGTILQHLLTLERHNRVPMVVQTPII